MGQLVSQISSKLEKGQFEHISRIVYQSCGINLKRGKEALVRSRLMKRIRTLGFGSIDSYMDYFGKNPNGAELNYLIDVITTNKTSFFREPMHFKFLQDTVIPAWDRRRLRFWTAACSSGEEPYTLAMVLQEKLPNVRSLDVRILATDISMSILKKASLGVYAKESLSGLPASWVKKYFHPANGVPGMFQVRDVLREMVKVAWLNLVGKWPMKGPFDIIFCRNVMIYFDKQTQEKLVNRFWELIVPGGYLFIGHSEGLSGVSHKFQYVQPAVYKKGNK